MRGGDQMLPGGDADDGVKGSGGRDDGGDRQLGGLH
jgi:hypothetical protein